MLCYTWHMVKVIDVMINELILLFLNSLSLRHKRLCNLVWKARQLFSLDAIQVWSFVSNTPPQGRNVKNVWLRLFSFQNDRYSWTKHQICLLFCCQRFRYMGTIDDRCCLSGWLIHHQDKETRLNSDDIK